MEKDIPKRATVLRQLLPDDSLIIPVGNIDMHFLPRRDFPENPRQIFRNRVIFIRKRNSLRPRPTEPCARVRRPFGGKCVTQRGGGLLESLKFSHFLGCFSASMITTCGSPLDAQNIFKDVRRVPFCLASSSFKPNQYQQARTQYVGDVAKWNVEFAAIL